MFHVGSTAQQLLTHHLLVSQCDHATDVDIEFYTALMPQTITSALLPAAYKAMP